MKAFIKTRIFLVIISVSLFSLFAASCSVVFTSSITGSIVDRSDYEEGAGGAGVAEAEVFLYTDKDLWENDYNAWVNDNNSMPDYPADSSEPHYFLKTISDAAGDYSFNGLIWNELFPKYGKTGDRKEVFLLFFHEKYGMNKNPYSVYVVSDVTNRLPLFKFDKIFNTAEIAGSVVNSDTREALQNANVQIWVPESWNYTAAGSIDTDETSLSKFTWKDSPSYTAVTDINGEWRREIAYKMMPDPDGNMKTTILRITYEASGYLAEKATDSKITNGGWDQDGNGVIDSDEKQNYFQTDEITADTYAETGEIALSNEFNTAEITGRIINTNTSEGEANVNVEIFVAEDWSYTDADPDHIEPAENVTWPEYPDYTLTTNAAGEYTQTIRFERKPSESDNRGTTRVRLVFTKGSFLISNGTDDKLTDNPQTGGSWDRDGSGTVDADEDDAYYDPSPVVKRDITNDLDSITIKQTKFSETLSGEVLDSGTGEGLNGVEVWLFFTPDHDDNPATPHQDTDIPVVGTTPPTKKTSTQPQIITQDQFKNGRFSFAGLEWEDDTYTSAQSDIGYYIYLPDDDEIEAGVYSGTGTPLDADLTMKQLTAGATNYVSLQQ